MYSEFIVDFTELFLIGNKKSIFYNENTCLSGGWAYQDLNVYLIYIHYLYKTLQTWVDSECIWVYDYWCIKIDPL